MSGACEFKAYQPGQQDQNDFDQPEIKRSAILGLASMAVLIVLIELELCL